MKITFLAIGKRYFMVSIIISVWLSSLLYAADVNSLIFEGADFHYKGDLENATARFEAAVQLDPKNEFVRNQLGLLYAKKDKFDNAFKEFSAVVAIDNRNTFAQKWLGILHLRKGEMNQAFERFMKIIQIDPNNADAYYFIGAIYNFRHNQAMAIAFLKKARDADSGEADTHFRLAKAFHNVDMIANAMLEYTRTLEIKPKYTKAINEIGWIYYNQGKYEEAITQWKKTIKINNQDRDAVFNLAKAYNDLALHAFESGQLQTAMGYWVKTIGINPQDKAAKHYLKKYGSK